jgi:hypothetical protein
MNWEAIGAFGELFGGLIVVASVIYLARQIRLNAKTSQDEAYREIFSAINQQFNTIAEPQNATVILKGLTDFDNLGPEAKFRFDALMHAFMTNVESSVISNEADLILDETMENWSNYLQPRLFDYPGMAQWWKLSRGNFHPDAQAWIDRQFEKSVDTDFWALRHEHPTE